MIGRTGACYIAQDLGYGSHFLVVWLVGTRVVRERESGYPVCAGKGSEDGFFF